jgi:hydrogenase maturation protease
MHSVDATDSILILGIGNVLMGDEGVGVHVIHHMDSNVLPPGIETLDGGTGGFYLLEPMTRFGKIVLIDAAAEGEPGTIRRLYPRFSSDYPRTLTAHDLGLKDLLESLILLDQAPEIVLVAVSIAFPTTIGLELTPQMQELVPTIAEVALEEAFVLPSERSGAGVSPAS